MAGQAQQKPPPPVQIRMVLHDPIHPTAELYFPNQKGAIVKLDFRPKALSRPKMMRPVKGSLVLYDRANVDPEKPEASLAASCKIPANIKKAMVVVLPAPAGSKLAYRMILINDSAKAFPEGESRVLPLIGAKTAVQAGEHKLSIRPGKITRMPPVRKVNEYNMAQTNFYYQKSGSWMAFTERQLQYLDAYRRLFIIYATPGALQPSVSTIVDTQKP